VEDETLLPALPHFIGPTWRKTVDGAWFLPEKTLGWGVLNWWASYVKTPGGDHAGEAFMPTLEQARWVLWWYAVDDEGRYCHRSGVLRRMKGWGKDPLAAALALVELCGPVAFSHFDAQGEPVGKPRHAAWIQIVAVSQEQTKNTMSLFPVMVSAKLKEDYGLEVNKTIIYSEAGGRIEAVTSSPHSMEGNRPTLVIRNETQWWVEANDGHALAGVIEGNVTKIPGARTLSICNAHIPGDDSVAERDYDAWMAVQSGQAVDVGTLYDALEAPADTPVSEIPSERDDPDGYAVGLAKLRDGIEAARGDSVWLPVDAILESVLDVKNPVTESRRKFLNQVNASEDSWIAPYEWDAVADVTVLEPGDRITLGFDGSKSNDWTALVACRVEDGCLFLIKAWNPKKYASEEVPREDVDATVRSVFERYDVVAFRADVKEFEAYVDAWSRDFKRRLKVNASPNNPVAFDMRGNTKRFAMDCERFLDSVLERELSHDGNVTLRTHVLNARRYPTNYDAISIRKASKDSSRKIDAAVCAVLAFGARQDFLMSKKNRSRKAVVLR
jgi:phage terminase large subunit-like protein